MTTSRSSLLRFCINSKVSRLSNLPTLGKTKREGSDGERMGRALRTLGVRGHFGGSGFEDVGEYGKYEIAACLINEIKSWDFFPEGWQGSWSLIILSCLRGSLEVSGRLTTGRDVRTKAQGELFSLDCSLHAAERSPLPQAHTVQPRSLLQTWERPVERMHRAQSPPRPVPQGQKTSKRRT